MGMRVQRNGVQRMRGRKMPCSGVNRPGDPELKGICYWEKLQWAVDWLPQMLMGRKWEEEVGDMSFLWRRRRRSGLVVE